MDTSSVTNDANAVEAEKMASMSRFDPLNNLGGEEDESENGSVKFKPNETIITNDDSKVGGFSKVKKPQPEEPINMPDLPVGELKLPGGDKVAQPEAAATPELTPNEMGPIDPAKMDFIKTYTKEFDDVVAGATHSVEMILDSIDKTVKSHADNISIPEEATIYLDKKPENGQVSKYDEAQKIVHQIMARAEDAKKQSEQAAHEASRIYDSIQQFRKDTETEIKSIRDRDEFGNVKQK